MTRFDKATVIGMVTTLLVLQSCISAEDPKVPPQSSHSGSTGGTATGQGGTSSSIAVGDTGGAEPATGGAESAGGEAATGGVRALGGFPALTGGSPALTGGSNAAGGSVSPATGGGVSAGGCDFGSTACTSTCASFASSPASSWKQAPCETLITCLKDKASCITAADPLCGPKQAPSYEAPACGNDYFNAASDTDISAAVTTYIKCICGF